MQRFVRVSRGQLYVLLVVCGVVGVRIGQVVCAEEAEAELGLEASLSLTALSQPKIRGSTCAARSQCGARGGGGGGDDSPEPAQAMHMARSHGAMVAFVVTSWG